MGANREYKSSVFSLLFGEEQALRGLYETLDNITLPPDLPITINTLHDALFKTRINDISFEVGDKLVVIIEHQSTINPNMPLRLLSYITRVYETITAGRKARKALNLVHKTALPAGVGEYSGKTACRIRLRYFQYATAENSKALCAMFSLPIPRPRW